MYCGNCGKPIDDNAVFCGECGAKIDNQTGNQDTTKKKSSILVLIIILLICLCVGTIGVIAYLLLRDSNAPSGDADSNITMNVGNDNMNASKASSVNLNASVEVTVETYPAETQINPYVLSGTMSSSEDVAVLTINGQRIDSVSAIDGVTQWETVVQLMEGENVIEIELKDASGNTDNETVTINYTEAWPFPYGTELTRTNGETNYMIYIRPGPSKQSGEPLLKIMPGDFTTTLIYLGEYQQENNPTDGVHNWYKVELPDGREGWIRDDLTMKK